MEFLENNKLKVNNTKDRDKCFNLSHPNKIPKNIKIKKCIFLYNHPYDLIHSYYRRRWYKHQINKLGNPYKIKFEKIDNIDKYNQFILKYNKDIFGIEYQYKLIIYQFKKIDR